MENDLISSYKVYDVRFPTSLDSHGSDAINVPDYSAAYVVLETSDNHVGYGLTFTIGRGNDIVCKAVEAYCDLLQGCRLSEIFGDFSQKWRQLAHDSQLRWLGPEKGVMHLALAAVINALWDMWARIEGKPMWKLLADMSAEDLVKVIEFRYIDDVLTKDDALEMLQIDLEQQNMREEQLEVTGYPAYTTSAAWLGYTEETIRQRCRSSIQEGFTRFKVKVGQNLEHDRKRLAVVREEIGNKNILMVDANQVWGVEQAINWVKDLATFDLTWIEEPTSPDDIIGHATINKALSPLGVGVATGEQCHNRVMFKQFLQLQALDYCQVDSCRLAGPNEILAVYLMAKKYAVPVCPHAGGVGLCELVQHLQIFDYLRISKTQENRMIEYVDHLHEHFVHPVSIKNGCYQLPKEPGYSSEMKPESVAAYTYPTGSVWIQLFKDNKYTPPTRHRDDQS